jgi:hypothetical protein
MIYTDKKSNNIETGNCQDFIEVNHLINFIYKIR